MAVIADIFAGTAGMLHLDRTCGVPIARQLEKGLRQAIVTGQLAAGTRIPSSRVLAHALGVARNTVTAVYEELSAQGYLEAGVRSGTRVTRSIPDTFTRAWPAGNLRDPSSVGSGSARSELSERGKVLASQRVAHAREDGRPAPFRPGVPALDLFPSDLWAALAARAWKTMSPAERLGHGDPAGLDALRVAIAAHLGATRAVRCRPEQVIVVAASQFALSLIARVFADPGDAVWVEDPCRGGVHAAFAGAGLRLVPIPIDASGLAVSTGMAAAPTARLAYISSSRQFPTGATMSLVRRAAILQWAAASGTWVVEDDYDGELRYNGRPLPSLQGMSDSGRVIYVGSFSRTVFPSLRLGYVVVPRSVSDRVVRARAVLDRFPSTHLQATLAAFIGEEHFARHLRRMRRVYAERQSALVEGLAEGKDILVPEEPDAGLHLLARLESHRSDVDAERLAARLGVESVALSRYYLGPPAQPALILGFAGYDSAANREAARRLVSALRTGPPTAPLPHIDA